MPAATQSHAAASTQLPTDVASYPTQALKFAWASVTGSSSASLGHCEPPQKSGMKRGRSHSGEIEMDSDGEQPEGGDIKRRVMKFAKSLSLSSLFNAKCETEKKPLERPTIATTAALFRH